MTFKVKLRLKAGSIPAEEFALSAHGYQPHGTLTIANHLRNVADHVYEHYDANVNFSPIEDLVSAAWCHDLVEDTSVTIEEVEERFGFDVAGIVVLVTDKHGANRYERHLHTYYILAQDPDAVLVKLCDRFDNHERSITHSEKWAEMYRDEYKYFKIALWKPDQFVKLWDMLDKQYEQLKEMKK